MKFSEFLLSGYISSRFQAGPLPESDQKDHSLSERLTFSQANGRILLGHDTLGWLQYCGIPHRQDYALPTGRLSEHHPITACPGMYYQTDITMLIGRSRYTIRMTNGHQFGTWNQSSRTVYCNDFLPWTQTKTEDLVLDIISIAPLMEKPQRKGISGTPLPGPEGVIYAMQMTNTSQAELSGQVMFEFDNLFLAQYEGTQEYCEKDAVPSVYEQVSRNLLRLFRPEGQAGLYMSGGSWIQTGHDAKAVRDFCLKPGESVLVETMICLGESWDDVTTAVSTLLQHPVTEWIQYTDDFWKDRLGRLEVYGGEEARISRDVYVRSILDNFNCIQTDETGRVLVHWQGAPSQNFGRMWGIDVEPTAISLVHVLPELVQKILEYFVERNEPRFSIYPEHSTPIMMGPLVIAGEYLHVTGDADYFREHMEVTDRLFEIWHQLLSLCHPETGLLPSRFSSDGMVERRYDHGTNVKFYYAARCLGHLMEAMGMDPAETRSVCSQIRRSIEQYMVMDGPFGAQISGGTNLDEQDDFYMNEGFAYYDGEDSSSALAPLYGVYDYDHEPWIHFHRYARSVFCSSYDPEMRALRWFPYGGAVDGTAYVSAIGGACTRKEMRSLYRNMLDSAVDENGSLYWWPEGENKKRMITRCSQGQGALVFEYIRQWLGITMDACKKELIFSPRGLLTSYRFHDAKLGAYCFDFDYEETEKGISLTVQNHNQEDFCLIVRVRNQGEGAAVCKKEYKAYLEKYANVVLSVPLDAYTSEDEIEIPAIEARQAGQDGILFAHFGLKQPHDAANHAVLLRFVLCNGREETLHHVRMHVTAPSWMKLVPKKYRIWEVEEGGTSGQVEVSTKDVKKNERVVLGFYAKLPEAYEVNDIWYDQHLSEHAILYIPSETEESHDEDKIEVSLSYETEGKEHKRIMQIPVQVVNKDQIYQIAVSCFGAVSP